MEAMSGGLSGSFDCCDQSVQVLCRRNLNAHLQIGWATDYRGWREEQLRATPRSAAGMMLNRNDEESRD